jgi:hypothetical protein
MKTPEIHDWVRHGTPRTSFRTTDPTIRRPDSREQARPQRHLHPQRLVSTARVAP